MNHRNGSVTKLVTTCSLSTLNSAGVAKLWLASYKIFSNIIIGIIHFPALHTIFHYNVRLSLLATPAMVLLPIILNIMLCDISGNSEYLTWLINEFDGIINSG